MDNIQDPVKQIGYIQQCLSNDKRPIGLFLGAGCPMAIRSENNDPLIPDIAGMTILVRKRLEEDKECELSFRKIEDNLKRDGLEKPNIEDFLNHIRALRAVAGNDKVRGLSSQELDRLDKNICDQIHQIADISLPMSGTPYHHIASWVDTVQREIPVEIFTTNYDLLMEQAFESSRTPYFDGFAGARKPFFLWTMEKDILPPRWARLWKLHGSINWYQDSDQGVFRGATQEENISKRMIHPSYLKYQESRRMPYLAMTDRLREFLKSPTATLIICGYSFRDEHINEIIAQGLQYTQTAITFALLFENIDNYPKAVELARERFNISVLARDGAIINGQKSVWQRENNESIPVDIRNWVKCETIAPSNGNNRVKTELTLGGFGKFGELLQNLVGIPSNNTKKEI